MSGTEAKDDASVSVEDRCCPEELQMMLRFKRYRQLAQMKASSAAFEEDRFGKMNDQDTKNLEIVNSFGLKENLNCKVFH